MNSLVKLIFGTWILQVLELQICPSVSSSGEMSLS